MNRAAPEDEEVGKARVPLDHGWQVNRVDIRSPLSQLRGHVVRIELQHAERGSVTDIGSGNDILGAAFAAVAHIFGRKASIISVHSCQRQSASNDAVDRAIASIVVETNGVKLRGTATGQDLIYACLAAYMQALTAEEERDCSLLSAGLNEADDVGLLAARPCQASGLDENGDWWLFASDDAGAAEAIACEFREEGYQNVRVSLPGTSQASGVHSRDGRQRSRSANAAAA